MGQFYCGDPVTVVAMLKLLVLFGGHWVFPSNTYCSPSCCPVLSAHLDATKYCRLGVGRGRELKE